MGNLDHVSYTCYKQGCSAIITLHRSEDARLRRTHQSFFCSNGHSQCFTVKTEDEKRIEKLESQVGYFKRRRNESVLELEMACLALGVCPFGCGWKSRKYIKRETLESGWLTPLRQYFDRAGRDLAEHLRDEHNATPEKQRLLTAGASEEEIADAEVVG